MIVRTWRTGVHPDRSLDYDEFAHARSRVMFAHAHGCIGVFFTHDSLEARAVITLWKSLEHIEALEHSAKYAETVAALMATGALTGSQTVELLHVDDYWLPNPLD
jgi:heme-degrading monooxygenase HmoA